MTRRLSLVEFKTTTGVELSIAERDALIDLAPGLRVEPTPGHESRYDLTPDQRIGLVCLPELAIEIRPKLPMASLLFLVSYACEAIDWLHQQPEFGPGAEVADVLAIMLARLSEQATRRGLLNGYQTEEESLTAPRGRIRFDDQIRRRLGQAPPIEVRHDIFTPDILENRLLLAALAGMAHLPFASDGTTRELARAQRLFGAVERVHYRRGAIPDVIFTRLNRHYQPAVLLATLLLRSASLDLSLGSTKGMAILVDMNVVFETFVRRALRAALGEDIATFPDHPPRSLFDEAAVVPLKPDLCLVEAGRVVWVGDAKYKRLPSGAYKNADLYQGLAYAVALGLPGATLFYAADEGLKHAEHVVVHARKRLRVVALDLTAPGAAILAQIGRLAHRIRDPAA